MSDVVVEEQDSRDELGRVHRLYAVLSRVNEAIVRERSQQDLLQAACRIVVEEGRFELAWIGFLVPETQRIRVHARYGRDESYLDDIAISVRDDVPEGKGPTGVAMREGRVSINNDTAGNPIVAPWREEQMRHGFLASASLPLKVAGDVIGVLTLYAGAANCFDEEEVGLLTVLAEDFSFALEAAHVARERAAAEEALRGERARLARDLHDSVTQALFAANLKAEALGLVSELDPRATRLVEELQGLNRSALAQMRALLLELRGEPLDEVPLPDLLRQLVDGNEGRTATAIALDVRGDAVLPPDVHVAVYRIAQEALNNIVKHAGAKQASVELRLAGASAQLMVRDDGCGFTAGQLGPEHIGLCSMRERACEIGAGLSIASRPGGGTQVTLTWPAAD